MVPTGYIVLYYDIVLTYPLRDGKLQENWKQLSTAGPPAPGGNGEGGHMATAAGRTTEIGCVSVLHEDESLSITYICTKNL
jgi:hypothetical protein